MCIDLLPQAFRVQKLNLELFVDLELSPVLKIDLPLHAVRLFFLQKLHIRKKSNFSYF